MAKPTMQPSQKVSMVETIIACRQISPLVRAQRDRRMASAAASLPASWLVSVVEEAAVSQGAASSRENWVSSEIVSMAS